MYESEYERATPTRSRKTARKSGRIADVPTFSGKTTETRTFLKGLKDHFYYQDDAYVSGKDKVGYARSRLTGDALNWFNMETNTRNRVQGNWECFEKELWRAFCPIQEEEKARAKLETIMLTENEMKPHKCT